MSAIKIKRVLQQVIGGTNQPIKLGGILEDGSDTVLTIENGSVIGVVKPFDITLPSASWTGSSAPYSKVVAVTGLKSTDRTKVGLQLSGTYANEVTLLENWAKVYRAVPGTDTLTFYAHSVPSVDLTLEVTVVR